MELILIRHGKTESNLQGVYAGCGKDEPLSDVGRKELRPVAEARPEDLLFTSPMRRARETAEILFPGKAYRVIEGLHEMDFGEWEGKTHEEIAEDPRYRAWIDSRGEAAAPGGESVREFGRRTMEGLQRILAMAVEAQAERVYLVAHGGTIMLVMSSMTGEDYYDFYVHQGQGYRLLLTQEEGAAGNAGSESESLTLGAPRKLEAYEAWPTPQR